VIRDPDTRAAAVLRVVDAASQLGLGAVGVTASPLPGPAGNVEYFLRLRRGPVTVDAADVAAAVESGPQ
jgi:23S rRNA (cytidine1920-2'-O)/16S rRNA (cytidine1409-2'-O)-methyltransferase